MAKPPACQHDQATSPTASGTRQEGLVGQQAVPAVVLTGGHLPRGDSLLLASCESGMFPVNEGLCHLGNIFVEFHFISEWDVCLMALCC